MNLFAFIFMQVIAYVAHLDGAPTSGFKCSSSSMVRLVGGSREGEGRLEMNMGNGWGSICPHREWSSSTAGVLCNALCGTNKYASSMPATALYGQLTTPLKYTDLECKGNSVKTCSYTDEADLKAGMDCVEDSGVGLCCHADCNMMNMFLTPRPKYYANCGLDAYTVTVISVPGSLDNVIYPFNLQPLPNPNCDSAITGQNATHVSIKVPYAGDCGVETKDISGEFKGFIKYRQLLKIGSMKVGPAVTRLYNYLLEVSCGVNKEAQQTIHLDSSKPEGYLIENMTYGGEVSVDMAIKVFGDVDYKKELVTPVKLPVGTPIFIQLQVDPAKVSDGTRLIGMQCTAFPYMSAPSNLKHTIIDDAEAIDQSVVILKANQLHTMQFRLQTFKIGLNFKEVYVSCSGLVCPLGDTAENCKSDAALAQHETKTNRRGKSRSGTTTTQSTVSVQSKAMGVDVPEFTDKVEKIPGGNVIRTDKKGNKYLITNPGKNMETIRLLPKD